MVKEALREAWRSFLISSAINPHIRRIKADVGEEFELLPSVDGSWWMPKEWMEGGRKDVVAVEIGGQYDPLDLFVHELAHKKWTSRSSSFKFLLRLWKDVLNICEDVRVEYFVVKEWGWVFKSWSYPPIPEGKLSPQDAILWGLYVKKVANSRREDVPQEWKNILPWGEVEQAYEELLKVKNEEEYEEFLRRWFPDPPSNPPPQGSLSEDVSPFISTFKRRYSVSEELVKELGGKETRHDEWFNYSIQPPPLPPALMSLLNRLVAEEVERIPVSYGGRYSFRRDLRGRKDCYVLPRRKEKREVSVIVDTSDSMRYVASEVRTLLAGINSLAKRGVIEGKVIFVAGGKALPVSLPTSLPIWAVKFDGGTAGYKQALPYVRDDDVLLFVSDLAISLDDINVVKALQGRAYFLYGGPAYKYLLSEARKQGFSKNLCFAPTIVEALQKALTLLGL